MTLSEERILQNLNINFDEDDRAAVADCFNDRSFSGKSPIISKYEGAVGSYFGVSQALACCNGTIAIELAIRALDLRHGAHIGLPPTAPIMTILPILVLGYQPIFYDIGEQTFGPDLADLERLRRDGLDALITVPMWGYPWDMTPTVEFCKAHGIPLIEDCAHAIGTDVDGKLFGTFGDISCFSTHERKLVSTGEGGFCLVKDTDVYERMRSWQQHGLSMRSASGYVLGEHLGTNYKISPIIAALGISQFAKLNRKIEKRRGVARELRERLANVTGLQEFPRAFGSEINGYALLFWCRDEESAQRRAAALAERGILSDTTRYKYKALYEEPAFSHFARPCPNAERLIRSIITLPCHEGLDAGDLDRITAATSELFS